jgi:hypothetical protein
MRSSESSQALQHAARLVVQDGLDLPAALRVASRHARRRSEIDALWKDLPSAVRGYQDLFKHAAYQARAADTRAAVAAARALYASFPILLLGAAAHDLAADNDLLEVGIHLDEDEALLRWLMDREIPYQVSELRVSLQSGSGGRRCTSVSHGLAGMSLRLLCLPREWQGRPLFVGGLPWPMLGLSAVQ